jgi:hypothetical protein
MPQLQASDSAKIKICLYCKVLHHNSEWSSNETATQIRAISRNNFDATHKQFKNRGNNYVGGCIQFLLAAIEDRRIAIIGQTDICPICLASPKMKYPNGQCKGKHVIRERQDGKYNSLCVYPGCIHHQLICMEHKELNQDHPYNNLHTRTIHELFDKYPELTGKDTNCPVCMNDLPPPSSANTATIFPLSPLEQPSTTRYDSQVLVASQPMVRTKTNGKVEIENDIPDCVMLDEDRVVTENTPVYSPGLVVHTQGQTVRLYSDLCGFYNKQVHTVFNSGAATSFRLVEFPTTSKVGTRLSLAPPAAITGTDRAPAITSVGSIPWAITTKRKVGTENDPPDCVVLEEDRFVTENAPVQLGCANPPSVFNLITASI